MGMAAYLMRQLVAPILGHPQLRATCPYTLPDDDAEGLAELRSLALQELLTEWPDITEASELDQWPDGSWVFTGVKWTKADGWQG
jgi:hypothetical protein